MGKALMVCGTTSDAGKSLLVTGLCRYFARKGVRVAPFKAQNMALNAFVTPLGGEIGLAQALQAEACGLEPDLRFNPVLLKPQGEGISQVILMGRAAATLGARNYHLDYCETAWKVARDALHSLLEEYELVILEGAGSPAEMNIYDHDITNLRAAREAGASVILVGDIERGGVLASLVGTIEVLPPEDRHLISALAVNKFRGDPTLFEEGGTFLQDRTGLPFLGVIPFAEDLRIPAEDSLGLKSFGAGPIRVVVVALPHTANFSDFDALAEEGCRVHFARNVSDLEGADCIVLPGTKSTLDDLAWLKGQGFVPEIKTAVADGVPVWGICGGYQMLGERILDPEGFEVRGEAEGLGLLPVTTLFQGEKIVFPARARVSATAEGFFRELRGKVIEGYEIHAGQTEGKKTDALLSLEERGGRQCRVSDGFQAASGTVFGCYLHGLCDDPLFRRALVNWLRERKNLPPLSQRALSGRQMRLEQYDRWADHMVRSLDMKRVEELVDEGLDYSEKTRRKRNDQRSSF